MRSVPIVLLLVLSAGCVGGASDPQSPSETGSPSGTTGPSRNEQRVVVDPSEPASSPTLLQHGCRSYYSTHRAEETFADEQLPEGFEPYRGGVVVAPGTVMFTAKAWTCARSEVVAGTEIVRTLNATTAVLYYLAVVPPESHRSDAVGFYWYPLEIMFDSEDAAAVFQNWGFSVAQTGTVSFLETVQGDLRWLTVSGERPSATQIRLDAFVAAGPVRPEGVVRYFAGDSENVVGAVDITVHTHVGASTMPSVLTLESERSPFDTPSSGLTNFQGWTPDELSYTWAPVSFASETD